jgi:hypothetical protein
MLRYLGAILIVCVCSSSFAAARMAPDESSTTSSVALQRKHGQRIHVAQSPECEYSGSALPIHCACINQLTGALCIQDASCQRNEGPYGACPIITCQKCADVCNRVECNESSFDK